MDYFNAEIHRTGRNRDHNRHRDHHRHDRYPVVIRTENRHVKPRIGETNPGDHDFANKVYLSPLPGGAKITLCGGSSVRSGVPARTRRFYDACAWRSFCNTFASTGTNPRSITH